MPLGAQDVHSGRILHITLIALSAVVLGAIVWAGFAQVSDVASATGTLEPTAHERRIEHIDGGQVARLLVREGDRVTAGQPLLELDGAQAAGDVAYARQRLAMVEQQLSTVKSLQAHGDTGAGAANRAALMHAEQRTATARAEQQVASIAMIRAQLATAERTATIAREDRDRAQRLFAAEAVTRSSLNQREQILNDAEGRVAALRNQLGVAGGGLSQADSEAASVRSRQAVDLYQEGNTLELQNIEANVLLKRALARTDRLTVRSPVDGIVKVVPVSPGSVVPPAVCWPWWCPPMKSWWSRRRSLLGNARPAQRPCRPCPRHRFRPARQGLDRRHGALGLALLLRQRCRPAFLQGAHRAGRQIAVPRHRPGSVARTGGACRHCDRPQIRAGLSGQSRPPRAGFRPHRKVT
jgi:multidrug efflux pump subunit AcrA (membrane-fusion protein)